MPASLQQLLTEQPPTTSGIHEAVARHSEAIFKEFKGILPLFLGKRKTGPFINLTLPNTVTQSSENLLQTISDLVWVYDLKLISFVSAIRIQIDDNAEPELSAVLITADNAHTYFQLPWKIDFDAEGDISDASRSNRSMDIIPREIWSQLFATKVEDNAKIFSHDRLAERFGGEDQIPQP